MSNKMSKRSDPKRSAASKATTANRKAVRAVKYAVVR